MLYLLRFNYLSKYNMGKLKHIPQIGNKYGDWEVIDDKIYKRTTNRESYWLVRCKCGREETRAAGHLIKGRTNSCKSCAATVNSFEQNYLNRIKNRWTLDADPTLKFAAYKLPKYKNTIIKRVLDVHKEIDSPYNTYKNIGLPPGLIAMPDVSAIDAVLNYENHRYFFFCADAKRLGFHKFAKTLSQHNVNAREYHRYLSSQGINR